MHNLLLYEKGAHKMWIILTPGVNLPTIYEQRLKPLCMPVEAF